MRVTPSILLILTSFPGLMLTSHAAHDDLQINTGHQPEQLQGVLVQTQTDQLFKTTNDTYLLIDQDDKLKDLIENQSDILIQSYRVCLSGVLIANTQDNKIQYPQVMVVQELCDVSEQK